MKLSVLNTREIHGLPAIKFAVRTLNEIVHSCAFCFDARRRRPIHEALALNFDSLSGYTSPTIRACNFAKE